MCKGFPSQYSGSDWGGCSSTGLLARQRQRGSCSETVSGESIVATIPLAESKREPRANPRLSKNVARRFQFLVTELRFCCLCPPLILHPQPEPKPTYGRPEWEAKYGAADVKGIDYESITCSLVLAHRRACARIGDLNLLTSGPVGDFHLDLHERMRRH